MSDVIVKIGRRGRGRTGRTEPSAFGEDFGARPPLASLGPLQWEPFAHAGFDLPRHDGTRVALAARPAKPTLVVFYLGFGCLQCVAQLRAVRDRHAAFAAAGVDVVAIGDQDTAALREALAALPAEDRFPFALLADPGLAAFRAWHCFDDFEQMPLHGMFLVDAEGRVRWQDIGAEPFTQLDWLLAESKRLLALRTPAR
jgi:peroxiredoxin